jgi:ankyrin repeat protein
MSDILIAGLAGLAAFMIASRSIKKSNEEQIGGGDLENQLYIAINKNNLEEVQKLLGRGADPNGKYENGNSILTNAIILNNEYIVKELLKHVAKIDDNTFQNAVRYVNLEIINLLLERGADPNYKNEYGDSILSNLLFSNNSEKIKIIEKLLEHGAKIDDDTFFNAVGYSNLEIINLLLDHGANLNGQNKDGYSILNAAIDSKNLEIVKKLLDRGAILDNKTFYNAVNHGDLAIVKELLDRGADPNTKFSNGDSILNAAVLSRNENRLDIIRLLLERGADPNTKFSNGDSILNAAVLSRNQNRLDIIRLLLEKGAILDDTTFYNAVNYGDLAMVNLLLDRGANPNGQNKDGYSILNAAIDSKNLEIVKKLLDRGAILDNKTFYNAVNHGDLAIVKELLDRGADPNTKFSNGDSILNAAVLSRNENRLDIIRLLLERGANPHYRNKKTNWTITNAIMSKPNEEKKDEILRLLINASRKELRTEIYKREIGMKNIPEYSQINENLRKFIVLESFWREACYFRKSQLKLTAFAAELGLINIDTFTRTSFMSADTLCQMIGKELDKIKDTGISE